MNKQYFFCYSYKLKLYLGSHGIAYDFVGNNPNNGKPYWGYLRNDSLSSALISWREINNYPLKPI